MGRIRWTLENQEWLKSIEYFSVSSTHSWLSSLLVMIPNWWSLDCGFEYKIFVFEKVQFCFKIQISKTQWKQQEFCIIQSASCRVNPLKKILNWSICKYFKWPTLYYIRWHKFFLWDDWCPCFELLVVSTLGFKTRVYPLLACFAGSSDSPVWPARQLSLFGPHTCKHIHRHCWR